MFLCSRRCSAPKLPALSALFISFFVSLPYQPQVIAELVGRRSLPGELDLGAGGVEGLERGMGDHCPISILMGRPIKGEREQKNALALFGPAFKAREEQEGALCCASEVDRKFDPGRRLKRASEAESSKKRVETNKKK